MRKDYYNTIFYVLKCGNIVAIDEGNSLFVTWDGNSKYHLWLSAKAGFCNAQVFLNDNARTIDDAKNVAENWLKEYVELMNLEEEEEEVELEVIMRNGNFNTIFDVIGYGDIVATNEDKQLLVTWSGDSTYNVWLSTEDGFCNKDVFSDTSASTFDEAKCVAENWLKEYNKESKEEEEESK